MRVYKVVLVVAMLVFAGNAMGMGKSDGTKEEVKSSLSKENAVPAKVDAKACPKTCTKPCCAKDAKACPKTCTKPCCAKDAKTCPKTCTAKEKEACAAAAKACPAAAKPATTATPASVAVKAEAKPAVDELFVTVNGVKVTQSVIDEKIKPQMDAQINRMKSSNRPVDDEMIKRMKEQMTQRALDMIIIEQLMLEKQKVHKIIISDEEIQAELEKMAKGRNISMDKLGDELKKYGMTIESLKKQIEKGTTFDKVIDIEAKAAGKDIAVSDVDIKKYYDENIEKFSSPEQVRASHILIKTGSLDEAGKVAAKTKIEDILKQARNGGDFAALAKEHSEDPGSKDKGGEYTFPRGRMVPEFEEAAFALEKVGDVSDVVDTHFGYHIIKLNEKMPAEVKSFDDIKDSIKTNLEQSSMGVFRQEYIEKLKAEADIVWVEGKKPAIRPTRPGVRKPRVTNKKPVAQPQTDKKPVAEPQPDKKPVTEPQTDK